MLATSPHPSADLEQEKAELLKIHALDRQAHFATDVGAAISFFGGIYRYVRDGQIHQLSRSDLEQMHSDYFRGATFYEWDDLEPPIVQISSDGSMAWMMNRFRVRYTRVTEGQPAETIYVYAGVTIYEKQDGKWMRTANVSTFQR